MALGVLLLLVISIYFYNAPLESPANPLRTPLETEAPWFFLWVQGLLKLGDKTLWGVLVPGALALLLLIFPWIDRNPRRLARKRLPEIALALLSIIILFVLSYMGTAKYGISFQPALQVAQAFAPDEGLGLIQQVTFDDLRVGLYPIPQESGDSLPPALSTLLEKLETTLGTTYRDSDHPSAWLVVEERQVNLKKVTLRLQWQDNTGETVSHERVVYLHRDGAQP